MTINHSLSGNSPMNHPTSDPTGFVTLQDDPRAVVEYEIYLVERSIDDVVARLQEPLADSALRDGADRLLEANRRLSGVVHQLLLRHPEAA